MGEKRRSAPQRRRRETRGDARKRFRSTGLCQGCGRKKNINAQLYDYKRTRGELRFVRQF